MKKKILAIVFAMFTMLALASCSDGKCDSCGAKITEKDSALTSGVEVDGEYCAECFAKVVMG